MKKLLLLVLTITTSTFFTGCSEDETEPLKQTDPIIGTWDFASKWIRQDVDGKTGLEENIKDEDGKTINPYVLQVPKESDSASTLDECEYHTVTPTQTTPINYNYIQRLIFKASGAYEIFSYDSSKSKTNDSCAKVTGTYNREFSNKYYLSNSPVLYTSFTYGGLQMVSYERKDGIIIKKVFNLVEK